MAYEKKTKKPKLPKLYLSGKMRGLPDLGRAIFHEAAEDLRSKGWDVCDPTDKKEIYLEGESDTDFLRKVFYEDTKFICKEAVCVAMLPGWRQSLRAVAEHALAEAIGLRIIYLDEPKSTLMVSTEPYDYKIGGKVGH